MTVTTTPFSVSYTAVGTSGETFTVTFPFFDDSDLLVTLAGTLQVITTNYTVTGGSGATGTITWVGTPTAAATVIITRIVPNTQLIDYQDAGKFPAASHEQGLDRRAMTGQQSLQRDTTDGQNWDADSKRIKQVATATAGTDAVNLTQLQAQTFESGGNLPTPANPGDDGLFLEASGGSYQLVSIQKAVRNHIMNPHGEVAQRMGQTGSLTAAGSTHKNDDATYAWDRWLLLSDGNDIVDCNRESAVAQTPLGSPSAMRFLVATANKKFGFCEFLTESDTRRLTLGVATAKVTLQFKARTTSGAPIRNVRAAIVAWTSVADQPTRDIVNVWGAEGTNPTYVANYTSQGNSSNFAVTQDDYGTHTLTVTLSSGATTQNLVVFIWVDDTNAATGEQLWISDVQLEPGAAATALVRRPFAEEISLCEAFYTSTFGTTAAPADPITFASNVHSWIGGTGGEFRTQWRHQTTMWRNASVGRVVLINPGGGAANNAENENGSADVPVTVSHFPSYTQIVHNVAAAGNAGDVISLGIVLENELGY